MLMSYFKIEKSKKIQKAAELSIFSRPRRGWSDNLQAEDGLVTQLGTAWLPSGRGRPGYAAWERLGCLQAEDGLVTHLGTAWLPSGRGRPGYAGLACRQT